ncbi:hypothetical protein ABK040_003789 [Willaertia magna]
MRNYQYFLGSVFLSLLVTLVLMTIVFFKIFITKTITKESIKSVPMWNIAAIGVINTFSNLFTVITNAFVYGNVNLAVQQALIINTVILSFLFLSTRFNALHYGGVLIVIIGIAVDIFPIFLNTNSKANNSSHRNEWAWPLVIFLSTVLGAVRDNCENISILIAAFTFFYVGNLITTLIVFKYGSSTLAVVISALRIITSNICFMVPFIAGPLTSYSLSGIQIESLIILVCTVVMYGVTKEKKLENDPIKIRYKNIYHS